MVVALSSLVVFAVSCLSCVSDVKSLRIPNIYSVIVLAAFLVAFFVSPDSFGKWWYHFGAFLGMFVMTFLMYLTGQFGSGDTKLASVLALWVGLKGLFAFMFYVTLVGGLLAGISLYIQRKKPFRAPQEGSWIAQLQDGHNAVPYGVAIVFGAWMALFHTGFLYHIIDELINIMN
ncbi:MAG: prepilin peptidase [Alphaproteobacteria bacterium]|nr:prepilin peptidase [Alphaproteobacteria bacterium]